MYIAVLYLQSTARWFPVYCKTVFVCSGGAHLTIFCYDTTLWQGAFPYSEGGNKALRKDLGLTRHSCPDGRGETICQTAASWTVPHLKRPVPSLPSICGHTVNTKYFVTKRAIWLHSCSVIGYDRGKSLVPSWPQFEEWHPKTGDSPSFPVTWQSLTHPWTSHSCQGDLQNL